MSVNPYTHDVRLVIRGGGYSLLERKLFKCIAVIYSHGGHGDHFARVHHTKFGVNNEGGVTRSGAINAGIGGKYKGYIYVSRDRVQGVKSDGYKVTDLGIQELKKHVRLKFIESPLSKIEVGEEFLKAAKTELPIASTHRKILKTLNLSENFSLEALSSDKLETLEFFRCYRRCLQGAFRFTVDDQQRIHYPLTFLKKTLRPLVTLEGSGGRPLAEVDIKSCGAQMMLKAGLVHPDEVGQWAKCIFDNQFYEYIKGNPGNREEAKRGVNAAFNGSRKEYWRLLRERFPKTTAGLKRKTGLKLMSIESLVMNPLFEQLSSEGIRLLRLHDSFLCRVDDQEYIASAMRDAGLATDLAKPTLERLMEKHPEASKINH